MPYYSNFQVVEKISQFDWILTADKITTSWFGFGEKVQQVQVLTAFFPEHIECTATKDLSSGRFIREYNDHCKVAILKYLKEKE